MNKDTKHELSSTAGAAKGGVTSLEGLTRYDIFGTLDGGGPGEEEASPDGEYVKFSDVERLFESIPPSTAPAPQTFSEQDIPADAPRAFAKRYSALLEENMKLKAELEAAKQQSESIAKDAKFNELTSIWADAVINAGKGGSKVTLMSAYDALVEFLDNRAQAAQAAPSAPTDLISAGALRKFRHNNDVSPNPEFVFAYDKAITDRVLRDASKAAPSAKAEPVLYVRKSTLDHIAASSFVKHEITVRTEPNEGWVALAAPAPAVQAEDVRNQAHRKDAEE